MEPQPDERGHESAAPMVDNGRARVVGETAGGSSGQPYVLDLGDGTTILVGAKRESFADGSRFEGVGIRPDVEIAPSLDDVRAGRAVMPEAAAGCSRRRSRR
jgi:C-terminal processing protease CtpA/Prc